jgi:gliding motility-associated-like protein
MVNCTEEEGLVQWTWAFGDGQGSMEWQPTHIYNDPGQYPVVLTVIDENNCLDSLELLYVIQEMPTLYLPSAFIPESEVAENRVFRPVGNSISEQNYEMLIYDRWGQLIFVSRQRDYGWDGYINGQLAPQGTYMYRITYEDTNGIPKMVKGSVLLMR